MTKPPLSSAVTWEESWSFTVTVLTRNSPPDLVPLALKETGAGG